MTNEPPTDATDPPELDPPEHGVPVDPLDERLSAELDGADGADGAPAPETASSEGVDPRVDDRRRALASARDLLAVPPPPLDDVTRRRMLRAADAEWPHAKRRDPRWLNRVAVAAALVVIVASAGLMVKAIDNGSGGKASKSLAGGGASGTTALSDTALLDLHEVSDPAVLRRRVEEALRATSAPQQGEGQQEPTTTAATRGGNATRQDTVARCLSTVRVPAGATPSALADATFKGAPAVVVVAHDGPRILVFVLATADCRLLSSQFLRQ